MLSALLDFAPSSPPCSFRIEADQLSTIRLGVQSSLRWFWIRASDEAVVIFSRYLPEGAPVPREIAPLSAPPKLVATFNPAVTCPSCSQKAVDMRLVDDWLVCLRCGRSWNPPAELLRSAWIHEAP
jgi:hypothetical protein